MKRQIMGREVVVTITGGKLDFGTWVRGKDYPAAPLGE